jgi:anthranilate synthase component 1
MGDRIVKTLCADRFTPYSLAKKLGVVAIFESCSSIRGRARYSILMVKKAIDVIQKDGEVVIVRDDENIATKGRRGDILDTLLYFANQHQDFKPDFPFPAGGLGLISYEFARYCDSITFSPQKDELGLPEAHYLIGSVFVLFDHYTDTITILGLNYSECRRDLEKEIDGVVACINDMNFNYMSEKEEKCDSEIVALSPPDAEFMDGVETVRQEIRQGNLLQAVLSRRLEIKTNLTSMSAYRTLRSANPSPYLFHIDFGEYQIFGASPESHIKVKNKKAIIRPLAGTRRRGKDNAEDSALEKELLLDPKERAEHLMLIDLARNDLGRICVPGTVVVNDYMNVERFSHVMHIVSEVEGTLRDDASGIDALRLSFPAGTVSGAPKIRAIEILSTIEKNRRSFYAGIVGYLEPLGGVDTCIAIRTGMKRGKSLILQAGAGILYNSNPERELEETKEKLAALTAAFKIGQ